MLHLDRPQLTVLSKSDSLSTETAPDSHVDAACSIVFIPSTVSRYVIEMYLSLDELFASVTSVSQVLDAKLNLLRLKRKKVITEGLISKIESADGESAKEILFDHLKCNADMI